MERRLPAATACERRPAGGPPRDDCAKGRGYGVRDKERGGCQGERRGPGGVGGRPGRLVARAHRSPDRARHRAGTVAARPGQAVAALFDRVVERAEHDPRPSRSTSTPCSPTPSRRGSSPRTGASARGWPANPASPRWKAAMSSTGRPRHDQGHRRNAHVRRALRRRAPADPGVGEDRDARLLARHGRTARFRSTPISRRAWTAPTATRTSTPCARGSHRRPST